MALRKDLHIVLQWLEREVTPELRREYEGLSDSEQLALCRDILRKNSTAVGLRKRDIDTLDDTAVADLSASLYSRYRHYIERMESKAKRRRR